MYILLIISILFFLGILLSFLGAKLIQNSFQHALVFHTYDFTDTYSKGFMGSKIMGLLMGMLGFESGIFSYMNNKISLNQHLTLYQRDSLINWSIVGQYLFVVLLFCPLYIFIALIFFYALALIWIDKKIYPHTFSIIISFSLIKFSTLLMLMGLTFLKEQDELNLFGNIVHLFENRYFLFTLGTLSGLTLQPLALILIVANIIFYQIEITAYSSLLFLSAVHLGIGIRYVIVARHLIGQVAESITIYSFTNLLVSFLFFLATFSIDQGITLINPTQYPMLGVLISIIGIILSSTISKIPLIQALVPFSKVGNRYYLPYAFNTPLYGGKLFGRELAQMISSVMSYSLVEKEESSDVNQQINSRFDELQSYANAMLNNRDNTLSNTQVTVLTALFQQLNLLRSNLKGKLDLLNKKRLPQALIDYIELTNHYKRRKHDALMTTYISILQNPQIGNNATLEKITKNLCQRINQFHHSIDSWSKNNLKDISIEEEDAVLEYLLLYESDVNSIKKISALWKQWSEFIPNYYHPHLEYQ